MLTVITYDVTNDRRRIKLHTLLLEYGTPIQRSVFECSLTEQHERELKRRIGQIIRNGKDDVRFYPLCASCRAKAEDASGSRIPDEPLAHVV